MAEASGRDHERAIDVAASHDASVTDGLQHQLIVGLHAFDALLIQPQFKTPSRHGIQLPGRRCLGKPNGDEYP
jgi:hypothetical protein